MHKSSYIVSNVGMTCGTQLVKNTIKFVKPYRHVD